MTGRGSLLKVLGVSFGLAVAVGNTIGAGILRTPGDIAGWLPTPWLFVGIWMVGAVYTLLGANAVAELGTMMPRSGAQYVFARYTFGDYAGFVVGWIDWISTCASIAAIAFVLGESFSFLEVQRGAHGLTSVPVPVAMTTVVILALLLLGGTKLGDRAQQITSLAKAVALLTLVAACFLYGGGASPPPGKAVAAAIPRFAAFILAAQAVIYAYDGWTGPIYFSEELHDPGRQIPRAMFGSVACVAAIYILINVAFLHVVPPASLVGSPLAAATVANVMFGPRGDTIVRWIVVVAMVSAVNANLLIASRVLFAISRDGLGVPVATRVNVGGTPSVALVASALVALTFLATGTFATVIAIAAFFFVANYTLSFLAVFVLRRREPDRPRPYRARGHPWTTGLVLVGSLCFLGAAVKDDTRNSLVALGIIVLSYPIYLLTRKTVVPEPSPRG